MTSIPANSSSAHVYSDRHTRAATIWGEVSWGPILMGAVCAIGLQFIFTVLGIALGTSAGEVTTQADGSSVRAMGAMAALWWLITGTLSLAAGGYVFGRLAGLPRSTPLALEAATMWGVVALFGFLVVWSGAGMLSEAASPIAAMSSTTTGSSAVQSGQNSSARSDATTSAGRASGTMAASTAGAAEAAQRATRTASWWSVIGLLMGLFATIGAAMAAAPAFLRESTQPR